MKIIRIISRVFVGVIFIFSGFVKDIDPLGSTYKFIDYFEAFHLSFLNFIALPLAVLLSTGELVIGINLLLGIRMRLTSYALLVFISFFSVLTFFLAIYNPVTDCGCFGDAIILTNWETFWKNIIILVPTFIVFFSRNKFNPLYLSNIEWRMTFIFILSGILISVYCYRNLPLLDFRPYKIGANISENMIIPENAPADEYKTLLVYEKNGVRKEFNTENFPWRDTTWKWVETRQILIKKGYEPRIHDFTIVTADGYDITDIVLSDPDYSFLLIADDIAKSSIKAFKKVNKIAESCLANNNCSFYCLTSSTDEEISSFMDKVKINFDFYFTDEITLKTIIRSNPGLLLIKEGNIIGKWHYNNLPDPNASGQDYFAFVLDSYRKDKNVLIISLFITGFVMVVSVFHIVTLKTRKDKD